MTQIGSHFRVAQGPKQNISEMVFSEPPWPNSTPQGSEHPISDRNPYYGSAGVWTISFFSP